MELYTNGKLYINGKIEELQMLVNNGVIQKIAKKIDVLANVIDLQGKTVYPAFFDEHIHGAYGVDFTIANKEQILHCLKKLKSDGVGSIFATLMSDDIEVLIRQIRILKEVSKENSLIKGIHLEGPFLSKQFKGAMPEKYLLNPSVKIAKTLLDAGEGLVKLITVAPELEGAEELIKFLLNQSVMVNLGHSDATLDEAKQGLKWGADGFTHTFNAMRPLDRKEPGILGCALTQDGYAEIISDGKHVHGDLVNMLFKLKGVERTIIITDAIMASGLKDGNYKLGDMDVEVVGEDAYLTGTKTRAGSTIKANTAVEKFAQMCDIPYNTALLMMTKTPANRHLIKTGEIKEGYLAEFNIK